MSAIGPCGHGLLHRSCLLVTQNGYRLPQETTFWMREFDLCRSRPSASQVAGMALKVADLRRSHLAEVLYVQFIAANLCQIADTGTNLSCMDFLAGCHSPRAHPPRQPLVKQGCHGLPGSLRRPCFNSSAERAWFHFSLTQADAGGPSNIAL
jgi:hypothetical protein